MEPMGRDSKTPRKADSREPSLVLGDGSKTARQHVEVNPWLGGPGDSGSQFRSRV